MSMYIKALEMDLQLKALEGTGQLPAFEAELKAGNGVFLDPRGVFLEFPLREHVFRPDA